LPHVIIVPPKVDSIADAMINAIRCFDDLQACARETHTRVREFFSWDKVAALHLRVYEKFCHVDGTC
jgi:glycosyltransferase involved in cell wall biosynthesis